MDNQYVSGYVGDLVETSGLPDDFDFKFTEVKTENFDFGADKGGKRPCLKVVFDAVNYDEPITEYYSIGKAAEWTATPDGKGFKPLLSPDQKINKKSKLGQFITYLGNAGYPTVQLSKGDFSILANTVGHAKRFAMDNIPEDGVKTDKRGNAKKVLYVTAVTAYADEKGKMANVGTTAASSGAAASSSDDSLKAEATNVICAILKSNPAGIAKGDLPRYIFEQDKVAKLSDKNMVAKTAMDDSLLSDGPWVYDGGMIKPIS